MQSLEHSLQGHFPSGHRKLKGHVLQLLLRQAVHTGHFPVAELLACRGRVCRCNDGIAPFGCRCGVAIDGKGAAFNGDAVEFLVNGLHLHVRALHGNSRSHVLFVFQLRIALENLPAGKLIARTFLRSNGNFRALFCRGDICLTIYHFNCMEFCVVRDQSHVIARHSKGDCGVRLLLLCKRDALSSPAGKLSVFFACSGHGDLFARKGSLQFCTLSLQLDGCIFCSIDVVAHFRLNAHILCRFCWDGRNIRVNCFSICCITGVVNIITSVGNALCNSAVLVIFKGRRAGAFNFHIATDHCTEPTLDQYLQCIMHGQIVLDRRP